MCKREVILGLYAADHVAISDKRGAMENWGLIIYRERYLIYKNEWSDAKDKLDVAVVIAHELAHQVRPLN